MKSISFFVLKPEEGIRFGRKWAYADMVKPVNVGDPKYCPSCGKPVSMLSWLPPHKIKLSSSDSKKWGDFIWGAGFDLIVSENFKKVYEENNLTGINAFFPPVEITQFGRKKPEEMDTSLPRYHLIDYEWFGANQDDQASSLEYLNTERISCSYCRMGGRGRKQQRIVLEPESWTGADIFDARNVPTPLIVSEKFKETVEQAGLKNYWFIPAERYGYDEQRKGLWYIND